MTGIIQGLLASIGSAVASAVSDAYFNLVTLLLNTSSTNGAQNNTFLDSSTNNFTITRNGNTTQGTFTPFSQTGWSNYFNGSSTISFGSNSALNILAYDTFECWVNMPVIGTNDLIAGKDGNYWMGYNFTGIGGTSNKFVFSIWNGSAWQSVSSTTTPVVGTWYHLLGVKDNTTMRFYVNGVQENTSTFSGSPVTTGTFYVASNNNVENFEGYISNLRLITGASNTVFPYSGLTTGGSFTPPTSALTAVTGTTLLTCQSNRFIDNSSNNFSATITSIPSVQAFSPFLPTAAYDAAVVGGSGYFDGSGDYLTAASNSAFAFGTGSFTWETWFYSTGAISRDAMFYDLGSGNTTGGFAVFTTGSTLYVRINGTGQDLTYTLTSSWINAWHHLAVVRNGTTLTVYLDGVSVASGTRAQDVTQSSPYIGNGAGVFAAYPFLGYLSGMRVVKGTAVYTAAFTPPTAPLTAISGTSLLLSGTNAGIYDSAAKNVLETVGNAQVSTTQAKFGTTSMAFDGTGDYLVNYNNVAIGTANCTIEAWIYPIFTGAGLYGAFCTGPGGTANNLRFGVYTNQLYLDISGGAVFLSTGTTIAANTWTHIAVTRNNGTWYGFVNGTQIGSTTTQGTASVTGTERFVGVLGTAGGGNAWNGYIDDLRVTQGYARYTANFTAPTAAFPLQ